MLGDIRKIREDYLRIALHSTRGPKHPLEKIVGYLDPGDIVVVLDDSYRSSYIYVMSKLGHGYVGDWSFSTVTV